MLDIRHTITLAALSLASCALERDDEALTQASPTLLQDAPPADAGAPSPLVPAGTFATRDGTFTATYWHTGTGCPKGALGAGLSPDGHALRALFSTFESRVDGRTRASHRDCAIEIELRSREPHVFTVEDIEFLGFAFLREGVSARATIGYHFDGARDAGSDVMVEMAGRYDDNFALTDPRPPEQKVRSRCGTVHRLRATIDLSVRGGDTPESQGYASIETNAVASDPEFRLSWRTCAE